MITVLKDLRNQWDYFLRQMIRWQMPGEIRSPGARTTLFEDLSPADRQRALSLAETLIGNYRLHEFNRSTSVGNFQENLFYLHMLEAAFSSAEVSLPNPLRGIDVGPSHWFYVQALYAFCRYFGTDQPRQITLEGYEADAYRVYADFHSRYDHALANIGSLEGVHYNPHSFRATADRADLITLFFPFVFEEDHIAWGLPRSNFQPVPLLSSAWKSLVSGGYLLVVNQGEREHQQEQAFFSKCHIPIRLLLKMDDLLFKYDYDRYIILAGPHE